MAADAKKYGVALFTASQDPLATRAELTAIAQVVSRTPRLRQILLDASLAGDQTRRRTVKRLFPNVSALVHNLLTLLAGDRAVDILPEVAAAFSELVKDRLGIVDVLVESAYPISAATRAQLIQSLPLEGKRPVVETQVTKSLLGGVRVTVDDGTTYDVSIDGALQQIEDKVLA